MLNGFDLIKHLDGIAKRLDLEDMSLKPEKREFPVGAFPPQLELLMREYNEKNGFPTEYIGLGLLAAFSAVAGNNFKIQIQPGWVQPGILWACIVGDSGSAKSPAMKIALKPLIDIQAAEYVAYKSAMEDWKDRVSATEDKKELAELEAERPVFSQILIQDSTFEALCKVMTENPNGLLQKAEELMGWINSQNKYRKGSDAEYFLEIYDNGDVTVNRVTKDTLVVPKFFLSVIGGIQHKVVKKMAEESRGVNGFMQRFIFGIPENYTAVRLSEIAPNQDLVSAYGQALRRVYKHREVPVMMFGPAAKRLYHGWHDRNATLAELSNDPGRREVYSKLSTICARLSLILQVMKYSFGMADVEQVDEDSVERAIALTEYFRFTSCQIFDQIEVEGEKAEKIRSAAMMAARGKSVRDIAATIGCSPGTISNWRKKHPEIFEECLTV